ncbi:ABC transporter substrate-binding protein [Nocardia sp. NPDC051030]|uniref:bifunctional serine/threonine-protein kinase/ABC transporter substrate-binding protein n=1 Tax=Nocardia sp. NPDC051030 TaxID=3155162 RepID=UPI0034359552
MVRAGEEFAGYLIERRLGGGGMGEVYLARHPRLPRLVAIKLLMRELVSDEQTRGRFEREAELVARLDHPNIVTVHDRGVEDGRLWIAMQYVDGGDAAALDPYTLPPEDAVHIIGETAKALDYAHSMGVVHRDVKPANILLTRVVPGQERRILLTDFGIGRLRDDTAELTKTGTLAATLTYASPEQLSGEPLDPRSDQYSLACTLFRLLTGATPFQAETAAAVIAGHLQHPVPRVTDRRLELPDALNEVLARGLAKRPEDRFDSCRAFAEAAVQAMSPDSDATLLPSPNGASATATHRATAATQVTTRPGDTEPATVTLSARVSATPTNVAQPLTDSLPRHAADPEPRHATDWEPRHAADLEPQSAADSVPRHAANSDPRHAADSAQPEPDSAARHAADSKSRPRVGSGRARRSGRLVASGAGPLVVVIAVATGIFWATNDSSPSTQKNTPPTAATSHAAVYPGFTPLTRIDADGNPVAAPASVQDPANDGRLPCKPVSIAAALPLTGRDAELGHTVLGGAKLAASQFVQGGNNVCPVTVQEFDTGGDQATAMQAAQRIAADKSIVAVIGPALSGEVVAAGKTFEDAGLSFLTPVATNPVLAQSGWTGFFRGLANDYIQGPALGRYLVKTAGFSRVCVVRDNGGGFGAELADSVTEGLGTAATCSVRIDPDGDPAQAVDAIAAAHPDAVYYSGYAAAAATLVTKLRSAGVKAPFVLGDGSYDPSFRTAAGPAATGTLVACPCGPATDRFLTDYRTATGTPAKAYAVEAYDLTAIVLRAIVSGNTTRTALRTFLHGYHGDGTAHSYRWSVAGELADPQLWLYKLD